MRTNLEPCNAPIKISLSNIVHASLGLSHSAIMTSQNFVFLGGVGSNG